MGENDDLDDENCCYCRYGGDRLSGFERESFDQEVEDCLQNWLCFEMFCFFGGLLRIEFNRTRTEIVSEKKFA